MTDYETSWTHGSLIQKVKLADSQAWNQLVEVFGPLIVQWCKKCGLSDSDSADLMQEVFVAVSRKITSFQPRPGVAFRAWLWTITRNKVRDYCRSKELREDAIGGTRWQHRIAEMPGESSVDLNDDSLDPTTPGEMTSLMRRALKTIENDFAPKTWQAFWQSTVEGKETAQIAESLEMSANGVRQAKSRVLRGLRRQLGEF